MKIKSTGKVISGRRSVFVYILKEMHYEIDIKSQKYNEGWLKHNTSADTTNPFEISSTELPQSAGEEMEDKIKNSTFPFEVKETLKETEDKSYKPLILTSLGTTGRIRLIRKTKILALLHRQHLSL